MNTADQSPEVTTRRSNTEQTLFSAIWLIAGRLIGRLLDAIALVILARTLQPADFGVVAAGMTIIYIVESVLEMPTAQALWKAEALDDEMINTSFTLGLIRAAIVMVIIILLSRPLAIFNDKAEVQFIVCALAMAPAFRGLINPSLVRFTKQLDFRRDFLIDLIGKAVGSCLSIVTALNYETYWAIVIGTVSAPAVSAAVSYLLVPYKPKLDLSRWSLFSHYVTWNFVNQVFASLNWQLDRLLLGRFASSGELGRFALYSDITGIPHQSLILPMLRPITAGLVKVSNDPIRLRFAYLRSTYAISWIGVPIYFGLSALSTPFVDLFLGKNWVSSAEILSAISVSSALSVGFLNVPSLAISLHKTHLLSAISALELLIRIPIAYVLIYRYGMIGAAAARFSLVALLVVLNSYLAKILTGISPIKQLTHTLKIYLVCFPMFAVAYYLGSQIDSFDGVFIRIVLLLLVVGLSASLYVALHLLVWMLEGRPKSLEADIIHAGTQVAVKVRTFVKRIA